MAGKSRERKSDKQRFQNGTLVSCVIDCEIKGSVMSKFLSAFISLKRNNWAAFVPPFLDELTDES